MKRALELLLHHHGHDGGGDELGVRMLEGRSRRLPVILEHADVLESRVLLQVDHALAPRLEHHRHVPGGQIREGGRVVRGLDDDLVGADAVHAVIDAVARGLELSLDPEGGKLVGDHADLPSRAVGQAARPTYREDLLGRARFLSRAERARSRAQRTDGRRSEVGRPARSLGGDDDPAADHGIAAELRHGRRTLPRAAAPGRGAKPVRP